MLCLIKVKDVNTASGENLVHHKPLVCCFEASGLFGLVALSRTSLPSLSALNIEAADKEEVAGDELLC